MQPMVLTEEEYAALDQVTLKALADDGVEVRVLGATEPADADVTAQDDAVSPADQALEVIVAQQAEILAVLKRMEAQLARAASAVEMQVATMPTGPIDVSRMPAKGATIPTIKRFVLDPSGLVIDPERPGYQRVKYRERVRKRTPKKG